MGWTDSFAGEGVHLIMVNAVQARLNPGAAAAGSIVWGGSIKKGGKVHLNSFLNNRPYGKKAEAIFNEFSFDDPCKPLHLNKELAVENEKLRQQLNKDWRVAHAKEMPE